MSKIQIFDTTLRDGQQTKGISYTVQDKIKIAKLLDDLGVDYIEGGWPGASPKVDDFFKEMEKVSMGTCEKIKVSTEDGSYMSRVND